MNDERMKEFLWFMCERQRIWERKEVEEQPPPWTDDPVLQKYHFCNVYRRLDAGTQYLLENIVGQGDDADVFFNIIFYRFLNLPTSYEVAGGFTPVEEFDPEYVVEELTVQSQDFTVFSPAYRISPTRFADSDSKLENIFYGIFRDDILENFPEYYQGVMQSESLEIAHRVLTQIRGVGDFLGYELVTDMNYDLLDFSENDFVNAGPGAQRGIELIWGTDFDESYEAKIRYLVQFQHTLFHHFDLKFPYWEEKGDELTCRDFEHSLCEYHKFWRVKHEGGRTRRYEPGNPNQSEMEDYVD